MHTTASPTVPMWVRIGLVAIGIPHAAAGAWAVVDPESWYESFPGWDPRLVAADPPYNAHLATDAGAGLLAAGIVVLVAAWLADGRSVRLALAAFAIPHAAFHTFNPSDALTDAQDVQNAAVLVFSVVAAAVLFLASGSRQMARERSDG